MFFFYFLNYIIQFKSVEMKGKDGSSALLVLVFLICFSIFTYKIYILFYDHNSYTWLVPIL